MKEPILSCQRNSGQLRQPDWGAFARETIIGITFVSLFQDYLSQLFKK